jgi:hypothetical protein
VARSGRQGNKKHTVWIQGNNNFPTYRDIAIHRKCKEQTKEKNEKNKCTPRTQQVYRIGY